MKKLITFLMVSIYALTFSQVSIERNKLVKDGQKYRISQYKTVFENEEARNYFKKAKTQSTISEGLGAIGGGFIGFGLAKAVFGKRTWTFNANGTATQTREPDKKAWNIVGIGVVFVGAGIPLAISSGKNAKKALDIENAESSTAFKPYFKLETGNNGLALSYNF